MKNDEKKPYVPPEARLIRFVPRERLGYIGDPDESDDELVGGIYSAPSSGSVSFEVELPED